MKKNLLIAILLLSCIIGLNKVSIKGMTLPSIEGPLEEMVTPETNNEDTLYILLITKAAGSHFTKGIEKGAREAAKEYGVDVIIEGVSRGEPVEVQLKLLEDALDKNAKAIILSALDSAAVTPYLERAQSAGVPVIGIDSGVISPIVKTTVSTDNYEAGVLAAHKLAEAIGESGKVGIIALDKASKVGTDRSDGFLDTMRQRYPGIEVLPVEYGQGDLETSTQVTKELLTQHPDIKGMFGQNEDSSIGIVNAAKELGKLQDIKIIGFDAGQVEQAVREGSIVGAISQNPIDIGYQAVRAAIKAYKGQRNPEFIDTGFYWYDQSNIDSPEIQKVLYD